MRPRLAVMLLALLAACKDDETPPGPPAETPAELVRKLAEAMDEVMARPEHTDAQVTVQHVLVGVTHPRLPEVTRTPAEAELLAAELLARIRGGEDFDLLVKVHTDDAYPGIFTMALAGKEPPEIRGRGDMRPGFGDVAWRLAVGEVGVARLDPEKSPFGYHLIKRLR